MIRKIKVMTRILTKKMMRTMMKIAAGVVMEGQEEDIAATKVEATGKEPKGPAGIAMMTRTMTKKIMIRTTMTIMTRKMMTVEEEVEVAKVQDVVHAVALVQ